SRQEQRRWNAFSRDIGDHHHKFLAILRIGIERGVILAGYGILWTRRKGDVGAGDFRRLRRYQPGLNLPRDFQVALHRDLVSQFQRKQQDEEQNGDHFEVLLGIDGRQRQHDESDEQKDAPGGRHFQKQRPEKLPRYVKRPAPGRKLVNFFPVDVAVIETVAGARVGGELRPERSEERRVGKEGRCR